MVFHSSWPDLHIPASTLTEVVLGGGVPADHPALVDALTGATITYGELLQRVDHLAAGLQAWGLRKGDVVAIYAPNCPEYAVLFHAVAKVGGVNTTANPAYLAEELAFQLKDAGAVLLVTVPALVGRALEAAAGTAVREVVVIGEVDGLRALDELLLEVAPEPVDIDPANDLVALPYSSGTTGLPKGVMLTHTNLVANLLQIRVAEGADAGGAYIGVLPFFHIYGMVVIMNLGLLRRGTVVTMARFELEPFLGALQRWPIALVHVVPPIVLALAKRPEVDGYDLSGVRWLFSGAAPLGAELTEAVQQRLTVEVRQGYGMTEASPATHIMPPGLRLAGSVGPVLPNTACRIVDPETGLDRGVGELGEVWVRGPQVMKGYLNNPGATAATVDADGWLHTGDLGDVDAGGNLFVRDRLKELIKVRGFQVAPAELEALLLRHPSVADAAVVPSPDEESGEVPLAWIVAREPVTAEQICAFVDEHVAHYKRIKKVRFTDAIPKSASGKILRRLLPRT